MDVFDREKRSQVMARVRSKNTWPELAVRRYLHGRGLRFRLHRRNLPGQPDLVLPYRRVVVFVHGCFWHGHEGCKEARLPATRVEFWHAKLAGNVERDAKVRSELAALGWRTIIVWECEVGAERLNRLYEEIVS